MWYRFDRMVETTVLFTGASSGIGREAALRLGREGARLALVARREEALRSLAAEVRAAGGPEPLVLAGDLGVAGTGSGLAERALRELGRVDVLVNNAGASTQGLAWHLGDAGAARAVFETNLWSPLALIAAVAPGMAERGRGAIVNTGSMARVSPFPRLGHYAASRAALSAATQTLALELRPRGVRVVEVALGPVDTESSRANRDLPGAERWLDGRPGLGDVGAAAGALVHAVLGDRHGVVHYPAVLRWVEAFPGLGRRYARRAARHAEV
jgi:short-subunit dehydrogenase